jgi:hypothetical protein
MAQQLAVQYIPVEQLLLDPANPRIAPMAETLASTPDREWVAMALGMFSSDDEERSSSTSYLSLKESIRANHGVSQPIIVTTMPDGRFRVVEGNTRVAIYLDLANDGIEGDWSEIPAIVRNEPDEKGEHAIRLQAHLVGPRPWRPYAKAKYLHSLYHGQKLSVSELHAHCGGGGRRREIEEYIHAYADMQEYYVPVLDGDPIDQTRFSAFVELQKPPILNALNRHGFSKRDFAKWVNDSRFAPIQTVRQLPRILGNAEARQKFLTRNATEALRLLEQPASSEVIRDATIEQLASALTVKMRNLSWPDANAILQSPESRQTVSIVDCYIELKSICKQLNVDDDE